MLTKEILEEKGFVFESEENGIFQQYVKNIGEDGKQLICAITPIPEIFVWLPEFEGDTEDGFRITLDVKDIDTAIIVAESIAEIE